MRDMISIITPSWNSEKYILETIKSVQAQTYKDWEILIIDDCSTDNTVKIVEYIIEYDSRVKLIKQKKNLGPGAARTRGVQIASGRYIAYLDADDVWLPEKLERQIEFMRNNNCFFSCTSYEVINDSGKSLKKYIHMPSKMNYMDYLTNNVLQTVGIMIDTSKVNKKLLFMPNIRIGEDAATWLQVLKAGYTCYGIDEILAKYRRTKDSLSSNKIKSVIGTWHMYTKVIKLPLWLASYCFIRYIILAIWKRIYFRIN